MPLLDPVSRTAYPALLRPWPRDRSVGTETGMGSCAGRLGLAQISCQSSHSFSASPRPMVDHAPEFITLNPPLPQATPPRPRSREHGEQRCCRASVSWAITPAGKAPAKDTPEPHPGQGSPTQLFAWPQSPRTLTQEQPQSPPVSHPSTSSEQPASLGPLNLSQPGHRHGAPCRGLQSCPITAESKVP